MVSELPPKGGGIAQNSSIARSSLSKRVDLSLAVEPPPPKRVELAAAKPPPEIPLPERGVAAALETHVLCPLDSCELPPPKRVGPVAAEPPPKIPPLGRVAAAARPIAASA